MMSIIFKPNGSLNVSSDPSALEQTVDVKGNVGSGEAQQCKNLRFDQDGVARTRFGRSQIGGTVPGFPNFLTEQNGDIYAFGQSISKNATAIGTLFSAGQWSGVQYNAFNSVTKSIFALNGSDRKRVSGSSVYEWGIDAPTIAPDAAVDTGPGLTGNYYFKCTYARYEGTALVAESNPSPISAIVSPVDQSITVTLSAALLAEAALDSQITHVRLYRTLNNGLIFYYDFAIELPTATGNTTTADSGLGAQVAEDHDRPPAGTFVLGPHYNGILLILKDNRLYFSKTQQPEYVPADNYIEVSPLQKPLISACVWNSQLYVATNHEIYLITGTGSLTFFPIAQAAVTGTRSPQGLYPISGLGIFHIANDGIYLYNTSMDKKVSYARFNRIFQGESVGPVPSVATVERAWIIEYHNKLYFGYRADGDTYPQRAIVYDLETSKVTYYEWGIDIVWVAKDETNDRLLGVTSIGEVWRLENEHNAKDGYSDISWEIMSKDFTSATRPYFPKWLKYDVDVTDTATATGELIMDGVSVKSHAITGSRVVRRRLLPAVNGQRVAMKVSGTGPAAVYTVELE
jgi:hypothetical protein